MLGIFSYADSSLQVDNLQNALELEAVVKNKTRVKSLDSILVKTPLINIEATSLKKLKIDSILNFQMKAKKIKDQKNLFLNVKKSDKDLMLMDREGLKKLNIKDLVKINNGWNHMPMPSFGGVTPIPIPKSVKISDSFKKIELVQDKNLSKNINEYIKNKKGISDEKKEF